MKSLDREEFYRRLNWRREYLELPKRRVAALMGYSVSTISPIFRGEPKLFPYTHTTFYLVQALKCSIDWLMCLSDVEELPADWKRKELDVEGFIRRFQRRRKEISLSYTQLAKRAGLVEGTISRLSTRSRIKTAPNLETLFGLAQVMDCSIDWLVGLKETMK